MSASLQPHTVQPPRLDDRNAGDLVEQCETLAQTLTPLWSQYWSPDSEKDDVGRVMFRLFGSLGDYVVQQLNQVADQRKLAFLRFFGIVPRPPMPAQALLSFTHTPEETGIVLPAGTRVAYVPGEELQLEGETLGEEISDLSDLNGEIQQVIFQTSLSLNVLPAVITAAYTVEPSQDGYLDQSPPDDADDLTQTTYEIFGPQAPTPNDHLFLIGDAVLFAPGYAPNGFTLTLTGENLLIEWFQLWFDGDGAPLEVSFNQADDGSSLQIIFAPLPEERNAGSYQGAINAVLGIEEDEDAEEADDAAGDDEEAPAEPFWLVGRPMQGLPVLPRQGLLLPFIDRMECCIPASGLFPQATFYNDTELDIIKGAQPFGETPVTEDSFYIGSEAVLAKTGASVRIDFSLAAIQTPPGQSVTAVLAWEFWNGEVWSDFESKENAQYGFINAANNFIADNEQGGTYVAFTCPQIPTLDIGGVETSWIRARIAYGNYGAGFDFTPYTNAQIVEMIPSEYLVDPTQDELIQELDNTPGFTFGYVVSDSQYYPPFILSMHLQYDYAATPAQTAAYNDYQTRNLFSEPYQPMGGLAPAFMIGFDPEGFTQYTVGNTLTLFFQLKRETAVGDDPDAAALAASKVAWFYYNGQQWVEMTVTDGTEGLSRSGIVSMPLGSDMQAASFFGREACWIRLENRNNRPDKPIKTLGVWPNTVPAQNYQTILDEVLGSGNGEPSQSFSLSSPYVTMGQTIEVIEQAFPTEEERVQASNENLETLVRVVTGEDGSETIYITWNEVNDFATSSSLSRHYTIDRRRGVITFGNGQKGMTAPIGENNIIAARYDSCRGREGNVAAGTITAMEETVDQTQAVTNHMPAVAGRNGDPDSTTAQVGPWQLRNKDLAVTRDDYEQLAILADTAVTKASAYTDAQGFIQVFVYIHSISREISKPKPEPDILDLIAEYIRQRMLFDLQPKLIVNPPNYKTINIYTRIIALGQEDSLRDAVTAQLERYFNLETGGPDQDGWDFGETIQVQDITSAILATSGVELVLFLTADGDAEEVAIPRSCLPALGQVDISIQQGVDFGD